MAYQDEFFTPQEVDRQIERVIHFPAILPPTIHNLVATRYNHKYYLICTRCYTHSSLYSDCHQPDEPHSICDQAIGLVYT